MVRPRAGLLKAETEEDRARRFDPNEPDSEAVALFH
jgi:hypothetical protein